MPGTRRGGHLEFDVKQTDVASGYIGCVGAGRLSHHQHLNLSRIRHVRHGGRVHLGRSRYRARLVLNRRVVEDLDSERVELVFSPLPIPGVRVAAHSKGLARVQRVGWHLACQARSAEHGAIRIRFHPSRGLGDGNAAQALRAVVIWSEREVDLGSSSSRKPCVAHRLGADPYVGLARRGSRTRHCLLASGHGDGHSGESGRAPYEASVLCVKLVGDANVWPALVHRGGA